eukprot:gnl/TRDRNA2_/TRDRNA2_181977_c0_seq1.p1 gnl/TRDRNA2_/TRDRNA2_181977_c0~~gnl/TRDRNA2_/TRDRNA2_181977_c0_seq1.p1  ORF type:complete len:392 (-),score=40.16 gnl/TRDRNA2_/TRDRNA2_181977_c0_seq1:99-1274(-)
MILTALGIVLVVAHAESEAPTRAGEECQLESDECDSIALLRLQSVSSNSSNSSNESSQFPIGVPGQPWGPAEKTVWKNSRRIQRSYNDEVLTKIRALVDHYDVRLYGSLSIDPQRYPLYAVMTHGWDNAKPSVLVTGGVHGYETSGVQGALLFLQTMSRHLNETFNILVVPCISPWGYETIQRWVPTAVDPNRSFNPDGEVVPGRSFNPEPATEESSHLLHFLASLNVTHWICHVDLHETTNTDETEFGPAKAARDGVAYEPKGIPDGFYLVTDETNQQLAWHAAMISAVSNVTHIAPADQDGNIIGVHVVQPGVIAVPSPRAVGMCAGITDAPYATTTEVYPDSPNVDAETCNQAQVANIVAGLEYIIQHALPASSTHESTNETWDDELN